MDEIENNNKNSDSDINDEGYYHEEYYIINICDVCKNKKCLRVCCNETIWRSRLCKKNVCFTCTISCERCNNLHEAPIKMCNFCNAICDKCNKNICYYCEKTHDEGYKRCKDCWSHTPLCHFCEYSDADYECERCYLPVCNDHKKRCFHCGTKCMECHENYGNCKYCINDLSTKDINEPKDIEHN